MMSSSGSVDLHEKNETPSEYDDTEEQIRRDMYEDYEEHLQMTENSRNFGSIESDHTVTPSIIHQAMDMSWSIGLNWKNPVIFLKDFPDTKTILYSSGNTGIIYDFHLNSQKLLRGHTHVISCTAASENRMWLITASRGKDATLNIWDMKSGVPVRTFFNIHPPHGVYATNISIDRKYLATISAGLPQIVVIWKWTVTKQTDKDVEVCSVTLDRTFGMQKSVHFSPADAHCLMSSSATYMIFYSWTVGLMQYEVLRVSKSDLAVGPPGRILKSVFHMDPDFALSCTSKGNVIMWNKKSPLQISNEDNDLIWHKLWRMLKLVLIDRLKITEIVVIDEFIVTGDEKGFIRFHDQSMHLLSIFQASKSEAIVSISFSVKPVLATERISDVTDLTIQGRQFVTRDLIFCTSKAVVGHVFKNTTKVKPILHESDVPIIGLAVHPLKTELCWASQSGLIRLWDYKDKVTLNEKQLGTELTTISYHPNGKFLGIGFRSGDVWITDPLSLDIIWRPKFTFTNYPIRFCAFSMNRQYFACTDDSRATALIKNNENSWEIIGKHRSHYGKVLSLFFVNGSSNSQPRLFSLGEDKILVEYDLVGSVPSKVKLKQRDCLEQSAIPLTIVAYPSITTEPLMIYANSQYKLKLINMATRQCTKLVLGPVFGSPVQKMAVLPQSSKKDNWFLAFAAGSLVGLQMLPPTGNPYSSMAIETVGCSSDGMHIFTLDSVNSCIGMWAVHLQVMNAYYNLGGVGMSPFCTLLEGGRYGKIFRELENYFYYIHLTKQGEDCMESRAVSRTVPVEEIPFIMRALGFFPSQYEIDLMINEATHSNNSKDKSLTTEVDIEMFLKLYINHRPPFGVQLDEVELAFKNLQMEKIHTYVPAISKRDLLSHLQSFGKFLFAI
uniref:Cilia- and flagella-associated protein 251 n=1 Tax=Strigamia maritima TaxID=126957 RepID=T1J5C1_STRMM